jgi:hypothetical protein
MCQGGCLRAAPFLYPLASPGHQRPDHELEHSLGLGVLDHKVRKDNAAIAVDQEIRRLAPDMIGLLSHLVLVTERGEAIPAGLHKGQYIRILALRHVNADIGDILAFKFVQHLLEMREFAAAGASHCCNFRRTAHRASCAYRFPADTISPSLPRWNSLSTIYPSSK